MDNFTGDLHGKIDLLNDSMEKVLKEIEGPNLLQAIILAILIASACILLLWTILNFSRDNPLIFVLVTSSIIFLGVVLLLLRKRKLPRPTTSKPRKLSGASFIGAYIHIKNFSVRYRKFVIVVFLLFVPIFLNMNNCDPYASTYLHLVSISPQTGLNGYESIYIEVFATQSDIGWGWQYITFSLHPARNENEMSHENGIRRVFSYNIWGNRNIRLFNDYYFASNRTYVLRIYINGNLVATRPLYT